MAQLKTKPTTASVNKFIDSIEDEKKCKDSRAVLAMMREITGERPKMWGPSIVGFEKHEALMKKLGKYKTGVSCLYIKKLEDVDEAILRKLIARSVKKKAQIGAGSG